ncbi:MAG: thioredoxin [Bacilli bacterium]|nr:thioredoxin [Bacilli bacterium]MDD4388974.1 thioredoxin [Bacilli bacterium]
MKNENFKEFIEELTQNDLVLVDFYADWSGPCRMIAPIIQEIAEEAKDKVKVLKVDVDRERDLAFAYNITSIPTLILFRNGEIVSEMRGFQPKNIIMNT